LNLQEDVSDMPGACISTLMGFTRLDQLPDWLRNYPTDLADPGSPQPNSINASFIT